MTKPSGRAIQLGANSARYAAARIPMNAGQHDRDQRGDDRAEDQRQRAELPGDRIPLLTPDEPEFERLGATATSPCTSSTNSIATSSTKSAPPRTRPGKAAIAAAAIARRVSRLELSGSLPSRRSSASPTCIFAQRACARCLHVVRQRHVIEPPRVLLTSPPISHDKSLQSFSRLRPCPACSYKTTIHCSRRSDTHVAHGSASTIEKFVALTSGLDAAAAHAAGLVQITYLSRCVLNGRLRHLVLNRVRQFDVTDRAGIVA